jgi:hypothetical protein
MKINQKENKNKDGDDVKFKEYYSYIILTIIKRKFND